MIEIGSPHPRQRARSSSHENTGMFSYQASPLPQRGQCDGGRTMDSLGSAPHRRMQTFRKLPMRAPNRARNGDPEGTGMCQVNARVTSCRRMPAATATLSDSTPEPG